MAAVRTAPENACSESQVGSQNIATNCVRLQNMEPRYFQIGL